jgi:hypothetical protein
VKRFLYLIIGIAFILITFFGVGPILLADGSIAERLGTLLVVAILYLLLAWIVVKIRKGR